MRYYFLGVLMTVILIACVSFNFDRYTLDLENQKLIHYKKPEKDLPLSVCAKEGGLYKCELMFIDEYYQMKTEFEQCQVKLVACQKGDR